MARPWQKSKIQIPPRVRSFMPVGNYRIKEEPIQLYLEEYEVIRLLDYEGLPQIEAARLMQVSRPTLSRIYERARMKIATMLTEARELKIEGGNAMFDSLWLVCNSCKCRFNNPHSIHHETCIVCGSAEISSM